MVEKELFELLKKATEEYLANIQKAWDAYEPKEMTDDEAKAPMFASSHFSKAEMACKCCGKVGPYAENYKKLIDMLEKLRTKVGKPINISCAYRCPKHNAEVGGVENSYHTKDMAADIWVDGMTVDGLAKAAEQVGFGGVGRYYGQDFVHVDVGPIANWIEY